MVRVDEFPDVFREDYLNREMPTFDESPFVLGPPLAERRVSLISTAGLHRKGDRPFTEESGDFRIIPKDLPDEDLVMTHVSSNFDRIGFMKDADVAFPINRLKELAADGVIGSVAEYHYSFMGATEPGKMEPSVAEIAAAMKADKVDAAMLCPV